MDFSAKPKSDIIYGRPPLLKLHILASDLWSSSYMGAYLEVDLEHELHLEGLLQAPKCTHSAWKTIDKSKYGAAGVCD